jgi:hypothetical protein
MGIEKTSALRLFFLSEPTDPSDSPERSDPFKSLICLKTYPRRQPMGTLAFPGCATQSHHAATKSIYFRGHYTLSANVEIGVPRCATQSRQP